MANVDPEPAPPVPVAKPTMAPTTEQPAASELPSAKEKPKAERKTGKPAKAVRPAQNKGLLGLGNKPAGPAIAATSKPKDSSGIPTAASFGVLMGGTPHPQKAAKSTAGR